MLRLLTKGVVVASLCLAMLVGGKEESQLTEYFVSCKTNHHLVQDRENDKDTISIAATGFGFYAWAIAVEDGTLKREDAIAWMHEAMTFVNNTNPKRNRGWLFHFIDLRGQPKFNKEVSTIDTALYYLSARKAALKLDDKVLIERVEKEIQDIDVDWMLKDKLFRHGLIWEGNNPQPLLCCWDDYNEGVIIYRLFNKEFKPAKIEYNLPLFVYYYPLCFYNEEEYKEHLARAINWQMETYNCCGVTACDGPYGYCVNDGSIISPLSVWAVSIHNDQAKSILCKLPYSKNIPSFQRTGDWRSYERIGIDCGSCLMILRR